MWTREQEENTPRNIPQPCAPCKPFNFTTGDPNHTCQHDRPKRCALGACAQRVTLEHSAHLSTLLHLFRDCLSPPEHQPSFYIKRFQVCSVQKNSYTEVTAAGTRCANRQTDRHRAALAKRRQVAQRKQLVSFAPCLPEHQTPPSIPQSCFPVSSPAENSMKGGGFFCASTNMLEEDDHVYPAVFVVVYLQHEVFPLQSLCFHSPCSRLTAQQPHREGQERQHSIVLGAKRSARQQKCLSEFL